MTKRQGSANPPRMDAAFKHEVVCLVLDKGMTATEAAETMHVGTTAVRRWVRLHREASGLAIPNTPVTAEQFRIRELESENRHLREDNDILKKASAFFARTLR
jgi:transposase